jgi:NTP pyrophosphatase (non-canonical NTP hydrolase)
MDAKEYQEVVESTIVLVHEEDPSIEDKTLVWAAVSLAGEVGEVCDAVKKRVYRKDTRMTRSYVLSELGDALWYLTAMCTSLGASLEDLMQHNANKVVGFSARWREERDKEKEEENER